MAKLKSASKYGQDYSDRSHEAKGKKKARYAKDARDDHAGFEKAPVYIQNEIREQYAHSRKRKNFRK